MTRPDPLVGSFVGNYQISGLIGEGGMARVYRAVHPEIAREVAVKVLADELSEAAEAVRRFKIEAQAVNKIRHPNIVEIFDFGSLPDGRPFYIMELLAGESLSARLRRDGPLSVADTLALVEPVLEALSAAHQAGIVHRDLKPDNVFLKTLASGRVEVKLLDFGIAKLMDDQQFQKTRSGMLLGTPAYMAPEQAAGRVREMGPRSDLYAVGVMMYEMLAGRPPFQADNLGALLLEHLSVVPPTLAERGVVGIPPQLSALVASCLAKEPAGRPASAAELRGKLAEFTVGLPPTLMATVPGAGTLPLADAPPLAPRPVAPPLAPRPVAPRLAAPPPSPPASLSEALPTARTREPAASRAPMIAGIAAVVVLVVAGTWWLRRGHSAGGSPAPRPVALAADAAPPDARLPDAAARAPADAAPPPRPPDAAVVAAPDAAVLDCKFDAARIAGEPVKVLADARRCLTDGLLTAAEFAHIQKQVLGHM